MKHLLRHITSRLSVWPSLLTNAYQPLPGVLPNLPRTKLSDSEKNRKSVSSGRKHTSSSNGGNGSGRHKKKDKSAIQVSSASVGASASGDDGRRHTTDEPRERQGRGHTLNYRRNPKSKSMSPRHRPKSPRPDNKEYDLWTDNRLVGDSDFSFF